MLAVTDVVGDEEFILMLKIDAEGYEVQALEGCKALLQQQRIGYLLIEVNSKDWSTRWGISAEQVTTI